MSSLGVCRRLAAIAVMLLVVSITLPAHAARKQIIFSTAPTQSPARTVQMYQPLADYLSRATGMKVILKPASNFLEYIQNMRKGVYDLVFDGPHFVAWRMRHLDHQVLVKLPGKLVYVVVVRDDAKRVTKLKRLAGRKVCAFASPNLLTLGLQYQFPNPVRIPVFVKVKNFKDALLCVKSGRGVAAVMRDKFWEKRNAKQKKGLHLLYISKSSYPHRAFSVSDEVDKKTQDKLRAALLAKGGMVAGQPILKRFRVKKFVPASDIQYRPMWKLLRPVYGFQH